MIKRLLKCCVFISLVFLLCISVLDHSVMYFYTQSQSAMNNNSNNTLTISFKYGTTCEEKEDIAHYLNKRNIQYYFSNYVNDTSLVYETSDVFPIKPSINKFGSPITDSQTITYKIIKNWNHIYELTLLTYDQSVERYLNNNPNIIIEKNNTHDENVSISLKNIVVKYSFLYVVLLLSLILLKVLDMIDYQRHIGIYKLHGINSKTILYKIDHYEWINLLCLYWFVCFFTDFIIGYNGNDHLVLLKYEGLLFLILLGLYVLIEGIFYLYISGHSIKQYITNNHLVDIKSYVLFGFKVVVVGILCVMTSMLYSSITKAQYEYQILQSIKTKTQNMVIIDSFKGEYVTDEQGWSNILKKLQDFIESQDSLYVESIASYDEDILHNIPNSVRVNQNILDLFNIKDAHDHHVHPKQQTLLVPLSRKEDPSIKDFGEGYTIQYIKNNQKVYSYSTHHKHNGWLINPIIVIDENNDPYLYMIPSHNINKNLNKAGIPPVLNFIKPYNTLNEQLEELNKTIQKNTISIILTSILMLILIYEYIFFYFKKSIMKISVLKIHGISFLKRYKEYFMLESICYALLFILSLFITTLDPLMLIIILLIDLLLSLLLIYALEKNKVISFLKGDELT